jgi:Fe-S-cluster containining protein
MSGWYADGLRFRCTRCGNCCTGSPGYVWIGPRDEKAIAAHLDVSVRKFRKTYTRLVGHLTALVDKPGGECVFLTEEKRCAIHEVKPRQCLSYPFWGRIMVSREDWEEATANCPGVGQGPLFGSEALEVILDRDTPRETVWRMMSGDRE